MIGGRAINDDQRSAPVAPPRVRPLQTLSRWNINGRSSPLPIALRRPPAPVALHAQPRSALRGPGGTWRLALYCGRRSRVAVIAAFTNLPPVTLRAQLSPRLAPHPVPATWAPAGRLGNGPSVVQRVVSPSPPLLTSGKGQGLSTALLLDERHRQARYRPRAVSSAIHGPCPAGSRTTKGNRGRRGGGAGVDDGSAGGSGPNLAWRGDRKGMAVNP